MQQLFFYASLFSFGSLLGYMVARKMERHGL